MIDEADERPQNEHMPSPVAQKPLPVRVINFIHEKIIFTKV